MDIQTKSRDEPAEDRKFGQVIEPGDGYFNIAGHRGVRIHVNLYRLPGAEMRRHFNMRGDLAEREAPKIVLVHTGEELVDDLSVNAGAKALDCLLILFASHV